MVLSKKLLTIILSIFSLILILGIGYFLYTKPIDSEIIPLPKTPEAEIKTKKLPIFIYHYVEINQDKKDTIRDSLNINPYVFEQQMLTLQKAGYKFIWPSELDRFIKDTSPQKYVMITFDDGYETFYSQTYHFIKKNNLKVTNYIISDRIGYLNYMNKNQIHEILKDGLVEIGSHTLTHPDLTTLSQEELKRQLTKSKNDLEKEFGVSIKSFCYPYGYYIPSIVPFVKEAGYDNAVTTKEGTIYNVDSKYEIKRFRPGYLTGEDLLAKIEKDNN